MAKQVIKQPDGKYAIFDSTTDTFSGIDATKEEVVAYFGGIAKRRAEAEALVIVEQLEADKKSYHQFGKTWEEAVRIHKLNEGNCDEDFRAIVAGHLEQLEQLKRQEEV